MLDLELTPRSASRNSQRRRALAAEYEDLFVLVATVRAASARSVHKVYFARSQTPTTMRQTQRVLAALVKAGLLERQVLTGSRSIYRLTSRAYASSTRVQRRATETVRAPLADHIGGYCWLRFSMWAAMVELGFEVGRGRDAARALRRSLVDRQRAIVHASAGTARADAERVLAMLRADSTLTPVFRSRCPKCGDTGPVKVARERCARCDARVNQVVSELRFECPRCHFVSDADEPRHGAGRGCDGVMREVDHLPFDLAWRTVGDTTEAVLLFVDNPERKLKDQLQALPLRIAGQPRIKIVLRSTDPHSVFDPAAREWICQGDRHRELLRAFSPDGDRRLFPFHTTSEVIDVAPELQLRLRVQRKEPTYA